MFSSKALRASLGAALIAAVAFIRRQPCLASAQAASAPAAAAPAPRQPRPAARLPAAGAVTEEASTTPTA
jgi:hypothetical protein